MGLQIGRKKIKRGMFREETERDSAGIYAREGRDWQQCSRGGTSRRIWREWERTGRWVGKEARGRAKGSDWYRDKY